MNRQTVIFVALVLLGCTAVAGQIAAVQDIALPAPRADGGKPLFQALRDRQSTRAFGPASLSPQLLSDLLWAAAGINRPESGKRTVPSARNWQEVQVYVLLQEGAFQYDAKANVLRGVASGDLRALAGMQDFVASAPLNLVYVADTAKITASATPDEIALYCGADTGFIGQNVYLFCASEGLVTVIRAMVDRPALAKALNLSPTQRITLSQSVGFPAP